MKIEIESIAKDGPRKVVVAPDEGAPFEFKAANLADAHKTLRAGHKDGWDSIRPSKAAAKPAPEVKAAEASKAEKEPRPPKAAKPKK